MLGEIMVARNPSNGFPIVPESAVATTFLGGVEGLVRPRNEHGPVFVAQHLGHPETHGHPNSLSSWRNWHFSIASQARKAAFEASSRFVPGSMIANSSPP